jgi:hypothetical protein
VPLRGSLLFYAPQTRHPQCDNPGFIEYHWHGFQLLAGNLYVLVGCALLLVTLVAGARPLLDPRGGSSGPHAIPDRA